MARGVRRPPRSAIDENAGIEHVVRIKPLLDRLQHLGEQRRPLTIVPGAVITAERVMVSCCRHPVL